ncbi:UbiA family prenyltransferase [Spirosoma agri]|uniref:UbiA family prenyltransferase n=1 Tax=Spirosoma agri TaxID=1987381 RepID=A0A6M0INZ5_9BACT|nr:UbiA family prenyltransferase [Spirosoma agri]NEU70039.1 UbiA family prenyltransferase [Spirosoma agri]
MLQSVPSSHLRHVGRQVKTFVRASEWWGYKFSPLLATAYATASLTNTSIWSLLPCLLLLLLALTVGAIYVSLLNDWTDRSIDEAAGKANRLAGKSPTFTSLILGFCVSIGFAFGLYFYTLSPAVSLWYLGAWLAYTLYSLPPCRLKTRVFWGILADAAGAHFFPQLFTVALISNWFDYTVSTGWWWATGVWAITCGIRNILWHQLSDVAADRQAGITTFVTRFGERPAQRLGQWVVFPLEVLAFGFVLFILARPLTLAALLVYASLEAMRWKLWEQRPLVLAPNQRIVLNEYYITFYPLALLLSQAGRYPLDYSVVLLHLLLFGGHVSVSARNAFQLVGQLLRRLAR